MSAVRDPGREALRRFDNVRLIFASMQTGRRLNRPAPGRRRALALGIRRLLITHEFGLFGPLFLPGFFAFGGEETFFLQHLRLLLPHLRFLLRR